MIKKKYRVEKSQFPDDEGTHLVVMYSNTRYGVNYQRVFKGTYQECVKEKNRLEEVKNEPKRENTKISRRK